MVWGRIHSMDGNSDIRAARIITLMLRVANLANSK